MKSRVRISAAYKDLQSEIRKLRQFNIENQNRFNSGELTKDQLYLLNESVFFRAFRSYENFVRDVFLLYSLEKPRADGSKAKSFLKPKNFLHADEMIRSQKRFSDWNSPDQILKRADLFLKNESRFNLIYTSYTQDLTRYKRLRNHIAHNSIESLNDYKKVLKEHYKVIPLSIPVVGEFLNQSIKKKTGTHLEECLNTIDAISAYLK